jgi:hypothetical protein
MFGFPHTRFEKASFGSIRLKLLKIGAVIKISVRRIKIGLSCSRRMPRPGSPRSQGPRLASLNARRRNASPNGIIPKSTKLAPSLLPQPKKGDQVSRVVRRHGRVRPAQKQNKQRRLCKNSVRNAR